jgi:hypothetical protein
VIAAMQHRGPPADSEIAIPKPSTSMSNWERCRDCLVRPTVKFLYGGDCLLYRVSDHLFRNIFADMAVGEMQCLRDQRMNNGVNPQMGALHLLDGTLQNFKGNVAHSVSVPDIAEGGS